MQWLRQVVDTIVVDKPNGEIIVSSGASPSGTYHLGHLREIIICDAIVRELENRGRQAKHLHIVDDLDALRKIPSNVPRDYQKYLGRTLSNTPAPDGSNRSYADYFFDDFEAAARTLGVEMEVIRSHEKYQSGFFTAAIEKTLENETKIRRILETVSGHKLDDHWSAVQILEDQYLKNRRFLSLNKVTKTIDYEDVQGARQTVSYADGKVKLNWRIDWPARWWLFKVDIEPFGRDHATKGGSYDTGTEIIRQVFGAEPPYPVPYDFVNRAGDTKKMSASLGTGIDVAEVTKVLPAEVVRYFMLRSAPSKRLYFDEQNLAKLIDEYAELLASSTDRQLLELSRAGQEPVVSRVPFSHLAASYQAALKDSQKTIEIISRTEHNQTVKQDAEIIKRELAFIDQWLQKWAPADAKFELLQSVEPANFSQAEKDYLNSLSQKIAQAPDDAGGEWFHKAIYELKESRNMTPKQVFQPLYRVLIGQESGPRAGWFLSILPRDWLIKRLKLLD